MDDVALVYGVPLATAISKLENLGYLFGTPSVHGLGGKRKNIVGNFLNKIEAFPIPLKDRYGFDIISTTREPFHCHTDEYASRKPAAVVLLLCVRQAVCGGNTLIAHIDDVLHGLESECVEILRSERFPTPFGYVPIISGPPHHPKIRFNHALIVQFSERIGQALAPQASQALNALQDAIESATCEFRLSSGQCLILRNDRVLHGRTQIAEGGRRLLLRMRVCNLSMHGWRRTIQTD